MTLSRKYISVVYDEDTQRRLRRWCEKQGLDLSRSYSGQYTNPSNFEFHTTVFYSSTEHDITNNTVKVYGEAEVVGADLFGPEKDIPVLLVKSPMIDSLYQHYKEAYNMESEWGHNPHVSISYNRDPNLDIVSLKLPCFTLSFDKVVIEDLEE